MPILKSPDAFPYPNTTQGVEKKIALKVICLLRTPIVFKHSEHYTFIVKFHHDVAFYTAVSEPRIGEM